MSSPNMEPQSHSGADYSPPEDGLNLAVSCVLTYIRQRDTTEWFHVKVRTVGFNAFVRAMNTEHMNTLPFSCWCDGGTPTEARLRQHRHFIVVSRPLGYFDTWLKSIVPDEPLPENFQCFFSDRIQSPLHLVNTLGALCQHSSHCAFDAKAPKKNVRLHVFKELPRGYRLLCALQWEGGLDQLLHQMYRHMKPRDLVRLPLFYEGGQWRIKIRDLPGPCMGTVIPVARDFEPCDEKTEAFLYLPGGRRLHFKQNPELLQLDDVAWLQRQATGGNLLYLMVGDDTWTPSRYHQDLINTFKAWSI